MGSKQITFKEGVSFNRPPLFWQKRIKILIQSIDPNAWNVIVKGPFILENHWDEMKDDEKRNVQDGQKAKAF